MALIPPAFLNSVVCIGVQNPNEIQWIGTGFLVGWPSGKDDNQYFTKLVTNKHVLANKKDVIVRFNSKDGLRVLDYSISLTDDSHQIWTPHPNSQVDVAILPINPDVLNGDNAEFSFFEIDNCAMKVDEMKAQGVSEGDGVYILGFPLGIVSVDRKHVIARSGIVARIRDVLELGESSFLIDANIFPGNSGGPVILKPEISAIQGTQAVNRAALIGIVKSYLPYRDVAISQQTGNPRVIFEENSGLACVENVDKICEAIQVGHEV
ncbi:serine protease [Synechococcus elongatus IITB4]|uniref:S1 family peptidase n=1 Tax=Synechococcus elongatus TaxID=32046 RepID=UPI0030D01462